MIELEYKIEFFSPWHCGSGMGGGRDADYCPIRDAEGFPFLPGKTVKGLFREAAETLFEQEFVERIFGEASLRDNANLKSGSAIWSSAEIPAKNREFIAEEHLTEKLYVNNYFIKIDDNGQTEDHSLRRGEYVVPMCIYGRISALAPDDAEKIKECMGFIKHIGLQRSRGFGRCRITPVSTKEALQSQAGPFKRQKEYYFKCRFLSPVVLSTSGGNQAAVNDTLEYIPGANFLGIAAREYDSFGSEAFDLFHSGKVRFGNAYPLVSGKLALPCPACWYAAKGKSINDGESEIFWDPERRQEVQAQLQPKQVRGGYFIPDDRPQTFTGNIFKSFSLKSAYDSENRKTEESCMFGYTALNEGTQWSFSLRFDDSVSNAAVEKILRALTGRKQIGRSKNSQYGSVELSLLSENPLKGVGQRKQKLHYLYAVSRLSFLDSCGEFTLLPDLRELGFPETAEYDMEQTQIRYHQYAPWNSKRKTRDGERLVILPGSVFVVSSEVAPDMKTVQNGVGVFLSEGYGELLYNPQFLFAGKLTKAPEPRQKQGAAAGKTDDLIAFLKSEKCKEEMLRQLYTRVSDFIKNHPEFRSIKASQWGAVRNVAAGCSTFEDMMQTLFEMSDLPQNLTYDDQIKNNRRSHLKDPGLLWHGVAENQWKNGKREALEDEIRKIYDEKGPETAVLFTQLLSAEMAKRSR